MNQSTQITTSGGLLSATFIENVRQPGSRQRGVEPESFRLLWAEPPKSPAALEETVAAAWELLLERWDAVRDELPMMDVSQVRSRWLRPLFVLLDFEPVYLRGDTVLDPEGRLRYGLSHRGWDGELAPVLHTVIPAQDLDERMAGGRGIKGKSPHDMVQAFLNASPDDLWAVVSNGILLRLLRDYHHTFTKGYVEFDLESIFETRNYGDFRALYRMCHASRFVSPQTSEVVRTRSPETSEVLMPLEQFYKDSIATGVKVGEDLRGQVRQAIETLGNGFLDGDLIRRLQEDEDLCRQYYGEILHIIYRTLFLLFAEQRGMMPGRDSLYTESYSIARLRARAEGDIPREDDFTDLWEGLKVTFRMVREGVPALGVFGYDGMLFEDEADSPLTGRAICNSDLLRAIRALTLIEREGVLQRISYADLGVEELGSIYESLLDYTPRVSAHAEEVAEREIPANRFFLDPRGSERKTTGSYYTHPSLVNELIKSALLPVARDRLAAAGLPVIEEEAIGEATAGLLVDYGALSEEQRAAGEAALLSMKVCDPAAGSGHFLVKADNVLGAELARVRSGDEYPAEEVVQAAKRDVLAQCIYAVDLNPMAVELCKVSLWINASVRDRPLSFLDHHIKCGNSLIGTTPELMVHGVPYQAFALGIAGDDRATANAIRKRNRQEQAGQLSLGLQVTVIETMADLHRWTELSRLAEDEPQMARQRYIEHLAGDEHRRRKLEADCWTASFFWPLPKGVIWVPTHGEFMRLRSEGPQVLPAEALAQIEELAERYRFFHWHLEFPDVFGGEGGPRGSGSGFDVMLGNPPWERVRLQEKEFFLGKDQSIVDARNTSERRKLIKKLPQNNPPLYAKYVKAARGNECESHFIRNSGRYPLTGVGGVNTYAIFSELARNIIQSTGRVGIVVLSGIATSDTYKQFFEDLMEHGCVVSLLDFLEARDYFPGIDSRDPFCLLTLRGVELSSTTETDFIFNILYLDELNEHHRRVSLTRGDIALFNPNTRTLPKFQTHKDANLARKIYNAAPVLVNERAADDPFGISFLRMFDMSSDSNLFRTKETLESDGFVLCASTFSRGDTVCLPLYEAKMMHQFDHRYGTYEGQSAEEIVAGYCRAFDWSEYSDALASSLPRYWIEGDEVKNRAPKHAQGRRWLVGFRDVARAGDMRTAQFCVLPPVAVGHKIPLILLAKALAKVACAFLANVNSFALDYIARQNVGGISMGYFIIRQFPIFPPDRYTPDLLDFIVPRVVELTYTAWDLQSFGQDILGEMGPKTWARWFETDHLGSPAPVHSSPPPAWAEGATPAPFVWDEERRARLRAELDGLYGHLYGLSREELGYILDTFPIVRRKDEARWGEYRTKRMVLAAYDGLESLMG